MTPPEREPGGRDEVGRVDLVALAELHAGLPDDDRAARARVAASADPEAAAVLDALDATRAELAAMPIPEIPPEVAARWDAALVVESARAARPRPVPRPARPRRRLALAAAAVVLIGAGLGALPPRPEPSPPAVTRVELVALGRAAVGTMDVGDLTDPARRTGCLAAVAPDAVGEPLLGGRRVVLDGRPGVLLVLATGTRGGLRIVTVDPSCGVGGGTLLAQVVVG